MKSQGTSIQDSLPKAGFTLIEIVIVMAIVMFIGTIGVIVSANSYQRYLFHSDLDTAVALVSKARSSAMHSIGEMSHGVYFGDPDNFILFRGESYASRVISFDLPVERSKATTASGTSEVIFNPPSGESTNMVLTLSNGVQSFNITINDEGGIDW